jgi:hypothetical protein
MKRPDPSRKRKKVSGTKKKSTHRRKRRVSGIKTDGIVDQLMKAAALGGGALLGRELNSMIVSKLDPTLSPAISGGAQAAAGFIIPMLFPNEPILDFIGYGLIAQGLMVAAVSTVPMLQGVPNKTTSYVFRKVNGANFNTIAGPRNRQRSLIAGANFNTVAGVSTSRLNGQPQRANRKSVIAQIY